MVLGKAAGSCSILFSPVIFFSFLSGLDPTRDKRTSKNPHDREDRQLGLVPGAHGPRNIAGSSDILIPALLGCGVAARDGAGLVPVAICGSRARGAAGHVSGHGGGELAALADLVAVQVEDDGDGDEGGGDAAEQRRRPLDPHPVEHVRREEREARAAERPQERVAGDGGGGADEKKVG